MKTFLNDKQAMGRVVARFQRQRTGLLAFALVMVMAVTACDSVFSASVGSVSNVPTTNQDSAASQNAQTVSQEQTISQPTLPGTEEYGLSKQELVTSIESVEALIAQCMSDAGFEYVAADYNTVRRAMVSDKSLPGLSEFDYITQYGFGISTLYTGLPPQLAIDGTPAKIGLGESNVQIFLNLSAADQAAYNRTLFGENTDATFAVAIETEDFTRTGGCTRSAIEQVFTPEQLTATYLNPKDALIQQDPRMAAALVEFGECLRSAGFDYAYEREIEPDLKKRLYAITDGLPVEALSDDARASLTELQTEERALSVVVVQCESRILDGVESQIERELFAGRQG
jgi:hypothetical protein